MGEKAPIVKGNEPITPSGEPVIGSGNLSTSINTSKNKWILIDYEIIRT